MKEPLPATMHLNLKLEHMRKWEKTAMLNVDELDFTRTFTLPQINVTTNDLKALGCAVEAAEQGYEARYKGDFGVAFTSKEVHPRIFAVLKEWHGQVDFEVIRIDMDDGE